MTGGALPRPADAALLHELLSGVPAVYGRAGGAARTAEGGAGMVSAAHPLAAEAGAALLRAGGTAFDAAVGVAAALGVTEPMMSGVGGYGTLMVHDAARRETRYLDACGPVPMALEPAAFRPPTEGHLANRRGAMSVSTPGAVPAWEALHRAGGRLRWPALLEPAIALAEEGFALGALGAGAVAHAYAALPPEAREIYGRGGRPLGVGERLVQRALAETLRTLARDGAAALADGGLGAAVEAELRGRGGFLRRADLARARAAWRAPVSIALGDTEVCTAAPPATSFSALWRLGAMSQFDLPALGHGSPAYLHRFAEVTRLGFAIRLRHAGDPDTDPPPLARLLSPDAWADAAARLPPRHLSAPAAEYREGMHTTHFVVADRHGNVVSATLTLGELFGSRILVPGTGIWLNNSLAYATWEPAGNPMEPRPGGPKLSGDVPVLLLRDGAPWAALGTPGGHTIDQTVPQVVLNLVAWGMPLADAVGAGRIAWGPPDTLVVEPNVGDEAVAALRVLGHAVVVPPWPMLGNVHALRIDGAAGALHFTGVADPRGEGAAVAP